MSNKKERKKYRYHLDAEFRYYIYRHVRPDINMPFYIGLGDKHCHKDEYYRAYDKSKKAKRSKYWHRIVTKNDDIYKVDIIFECNCYEELERKEIEFIALYGRRDLGLGTLCNLTNGGGGTKDYIYPEHVKKYFSELYGGKKWSLEKKKQVYKHNDIPILQFDKNNNLIKEWESLLIASEELKIPVQFINNVLSGKWQSTQDFMFIRKSEYNPQKDYTYIPSIKIVNSLMNIKKEIPVVQLNLDTSFVKEWKSGREAARGLNTSSCNICEACKGTQKTAAGFIWIYKSEYIPDTDNSVKLNRNQRKIAQLELNGDFIKEWTNAREASETLNIVERKIFRCMNPKEHTHQAGGFKWMYLEDYKLLLNIINYYTN